MQCDPIEAYGRYGHALELRVGHHAPMWNYHHHEGLTEMLEALFIPKPFVEVNDMRYRDGTKYIIEREIYLTTILQRHMLLCENIIILPRLKGISSSLTAVAYNI